MGSKDEITWEHFRDAARVDKRVWKILLEHGINDSAAYHMQQSVEKYLKAVILKYDLLDPSTKIWVHTPFTFFFQELMEKVIKEMENDSDKTYTRLKSLDNIDDAREYLKSFNEGIEEAIDNKHLLWKISLEVDLTKEELLKCRELKILKVLEFPNTDMGHSVIEFIKAITKNQDFKSKYTDDSKYNASLLIIHSLWIFLYMSPHMDIGRYPTLIGKMLSTEGYKKLPMVLYLEVNADLFCENAEEILDRFN